MKRFFFTVYYLLMSVFVMAQNMDLHKEEPTDFMRTNGKIYVVVAVVTVIVSGLFIYLINLDRKISKLEKDKK